MVPNLAKGATSVGLWNQRRGSTGRPWDAEAAVLSALVHVGDPGAMQKYMVDRSTHQTPSDFCSDVEFGGVSAGSGVET